MITKMTKYSFILLTGEAEAFLKRLQDLGVVDISRSVRPVDAASSAMLERTAGIKKAISILEKTDYSKDPDYDAIREAAGNVSVPDDLTGFPLIMPWREDVRSDLASWFGDRYDRLDVAATYNLVTNAANMVKNQVGSVLCLESGQSYNGLRFVPLCPQREAWAILAWKKNQPFSPAASKFLKFCRDSCASAASDPSDED